VGVDEQKPSIVARHAPEPRAELPLC
jgi:hypothetical protein